MSRVFCIANQKGGVGKTTTAINLSHCLARAGFHTLLVDLDPQCNATTGLGFDPLEHHPLVADDDLTNSIIVAAEPNLHLLPGSRSFADVDKLARSEDSQGDTLRRHILNGTSSYDYVLIDCPPSTGPLTQTALSASTEVLMPIQCEYFAMEGLTQMIHVIRDVMQTENSKLEFGGILLTMYDDQLELTAEVDKEVREFFGEIVFDTPIPRDPHLAEAPSHGESIIQYAPRSRGAHAYTELCMEVLDYE